MVSKEATLDVVEQVIDTVDETAETLERIPHLALNGTTRGQQRLILATVALVSAGAGAAVSHLVTRKVLGLKFDQELEEQIEAARRNYELRPPAEKPSPLELAAVREQVEARENEFEQVVRPYSGEETNVVERSGEEAVINIFTENTVVGNWNQAVEESKRSPDEPYVISKDEYFEGILDHTQETLTYYVGDDTLADLNDNAIPVHEVDMMVGESNLLRFGHGSEDDEVVYVRNDRLEIDYEITRNKGKYAHEVAGYIEHSDGGQKIRKFRGSDG